jgi:hypothetical protein
LGSEKENLFKYLATGGSFVSLGYSFRVGKNTIKGTVRVSEKAIKPFGSTATNIYGSPYFGRMAVNCR